MEKSKVRSNFTCFYLDYNYSGKYDKNILECFIPKQKLRQQKVVAWSSGTEKS